ncbi:MAG: hypothetical protein ACYCX4_15070 [Bacillota bacterium]
MSKRTLKISMLLVLALLVLMMTIPTMALANPTYYSKIPSSGYTKSCTLCHTSPPTLNEFGQKFKAAGYDFSKLSTKPSTDNTTTKPAPTTKPTTVTQKPAPKTTLSPIAELSRKVAYLFKRLTQYIAVLNDLSKKVAVIDQKATDANQKADALKGVTPKFAIPMREYGQRYANMYYAAKGGNWGLAAYMMKYMKGAMSPASLTKPDEYKYLQDWQKTNFPTIVSAMEKKDFPAFEKAFNDTIGACNTCHAGMGYPFVVYKLPAQPFDAHLDYSKATEPTLFAEFNTLK